jgi:hypothetical protein
MVFKSLGLQFLQIFKLFPVGLSYCGSKWVKGNGRVIKNHMLWTSFTWRHMMIWRPTIWLLNFQTHGDHGQQLCLTNGNNKKQSFGSSISLRCHKHEVGLLWIPTKSAKKYDSKKSNATSLQIRLGITEQTTNHKPQHIWILRSLQVFKFLDERQIERMRSLQTPNNKY